MLKLRVWKRWQRWKRWIAPVVAVITAAVVVLTFGLAVLSQDLAQQLDAAVQARNWDRSIQLVNQMLQQAGPQEQPQLESYLQQLQQLQAADSGSSQPATTDPAANSAPGRQAAPANTTLETTVSSEQTPSPPLMPLVAELPRGLSQYRLTDDGDYLDGLDRHYGNCISHYTHFPITVSIQSDHGEWSSRARESVKLWSRYVPMRIVRGRTEADITLERVPNMAGVAGFAQPNHYVAEDGTLQYRARIAIGEFPLGLVALQGTMMHEIGHALGIWGHSGDRRDLMYPTLDLIPQITKRDLNTLRQVYAQPTYIGVAQDVESSDPRQRLIEWQQKMAEANAQACA